MKTSLFERALGESWLKLPLTIRTLHSPQETGNVFLGIVTVRRGTSVPARLANLLLRLPPEGQNQAIRFTITSIHRQPVGSSDAGVSEKWVRSIGGTHMTSVYKPSPSPGHFREQLGLVEVEMKLKSSTAGIDLVPVRAWLLRMPLSRHLLPKIRAREFENQGKYHFDVQVRMPLIGWLIVHYKGHLVPSFTLNTSKTE